jgi:hypothetical protein
LRGGVKIIGQDAQHLAGLGHDLHLAHRLLLGLRRPAPWRRGRKPMRSDRIGPPWPTGSSSITSSGVLRLKRVTMRHCASSSLFHR